MAKIAKTGDRKKVMDTNKSTDCPKCSKPTRIVKRVKDRERNVPGGVYISCSACDLLRKTLDARDPQGRIQSVEDEERPLKMAALFPA